MTKIINNTFKKEKEEKRIRLIWVLKQMSSFPEKNIELEATNLSPDQFEVVELLQRDFRKGGCDLIMCYDEIIENQDQKTGRKCIGFFIGHWNDGIL